MPTRREFLGNFAALACLPDQEVSGRNAVPSFAIREERHRLNQESGRGFRSLMVPRLATEGSPDIIIAPAVCHLRWAEGRQLRQRVREGASLILESGLAFSKPHESQEQTSLLNDLFELGLHVPVPVTAAGCTSGMHVTYRWPVQHLTRTFEAITPLDCPRSQAIAFFGSQAICLAKRFDAGLFVYLGSMLGPGLFAEEREALSIGAALLDFCASTTITERSRKN